MSVIFNKFIRLIAASLDFCDHNFAPFHGCFSAAVWKCHKIGVNFWPCWLIYWNNILIETMYLLKQYTHTDFFVTSQKEWPVFVVFCFVSTIKKPTYSQLLTSFCSNQMFGDVILLNLFLDLIIIDELVVFCWSFEFFNVDLLFL